LVDDVIDTLRRFGPVEVTTLDGREEHIEFRLPAQLLDVKNPERISNRR
jgi:4-hydroxy-3-methylbut-2-en-1-yl diphosphate reductase